MSSDILIWFYHVTSVVNPLLSFCFRHSNPPNSKPFAKQLIEWYRPTVPPYMQIPRPLMPAMLSGGQLTRPSLLAPPAQWQLWLAQNQRLNPVVLPQPAPPPVTPYVPPPALAGAPVAPVGPILGTSQRRQKASTEVLHRNYAHSMTAKVKVKRKP